MISSAESEKKSEFGPLLRFEMNMGGFSSDWANCDRLSSYVARMIGHNRADSLLFSNLFSSALNELLETVFRVHGPGGDFVCNVSRRGRIDRIELTVPCDRAQRKFYDDAAAVMGSPEIGEHYKKALFAEGPLPPSVGLLELAVDYKADISIRAIGDDAIQLIADLSLEDGGV
jgi:hypothetical protein